MEGTSAVRVLSAKADVAVVAPCRNGERYLPAVVASVATQTEAPRAMVLADDGSMDATYPVAAAAGWQVVRTAGTRIAGVGIAAARNAALRTIATRYVAFLDADDWWEPDHLEDATALLDAHPEAVLCFGAMRRSNRPQDEPMPGDVPERRPFDGLPGLLRTNFIPVSAVVARRDVVVACGGFDETLRAAEDYDLWLRMAERGPVVYRGARSLNYRVHEGQISRKTLLMGESALRVRADALARIRTMPMAAERRDLLVEACRIGWDESLDGLWYFGHLPAYRAWASRYRAAFGCVPPDGSLRAGLIGPGVTVLRRLLGRIPHD